MPVLILVCWLAVADAIALRAAAVQEPEVPLDCACDGRFSQGQHVAFVIESASPPVRRGDSATVVAAYGPADGDRWPLLVDVEGWELGHGSCESVGCGTCVPGGNSRLWVGCLDVVALPGNGSEAHEGEEPHGDAPGHAEHEYTHASLAIDIFLVTLGLGFTCYVSRRKGAFLQAMSDNVELATMVRNAAGEECSGLALWLYKARLSEYYPQAAKLAHDHFVFELDDFLERQGIENELEKALAGEMGLLRSVTRSTLHAAISEFNDLPDHLALEASMGEDSLYRLSLNVPDWYLNPAEAVESANLRLVLDSPRALLRAGSGDMSPFVRMAKTTLLFLEACVRDGARKWDLNSKSGGDDGTMGEAAMKYEDAHSKIRIQAQAEYSRVPSAVQELRKRVDTSHLKIQSDTIRADPKRVGTAKRVYELYAQGVIMKKKYFNPLIYKLAIKLPGSGIHICPLKGLLRTLEKVALRPQDGMPWDVVRAQVMCTTMTQIVQVMSIISKTPEAVILHVVDRFSCPRSGWADICLYVTFRDPACDQVVGEIQIVHEKLLAIREKFSPERDEAYAEGRFAAELKRGISSPLDSDLDLSFIPWSQL